MRDVTNQQIVLPYARRLPRRTTRVVMTDAILHFLVQGALFFATFVRGMSRFDSGRPPTYDERIASAAFHALSFPVLKLVRALHLHIPGVAGWLVFFANSLCWGVVALLLVRLWERRRDRIRD